ncbi:MAG: hypothetical protein AAF907_08580 [Planctomycetota bacterium]
MSRRSPRRPLIRWGGVTLLAAVVAGPIAGAAAQDRDPASGGRAGYGPTLAERRAAVRLAQRERDAARRRAGGYRFGDFSDGVPDAALTGPRAPRNRREPGALITQVKVVVLVDGAAGALGARRWREALGSLGVDASVRTGRPGDEIGVSESVGVGLRTVTATGRLTPGGTLAFPDRQFAPTDRPALKKWVESLNTHGAAGDPSGQPLWGLSPSQFRTVFAALAEPAPAGFAEASNGPLVPAMLALKLPPALPVRFTEAARTKLAQPDAARDGRLPRLSKGASLAVLLARRGVAFHPTRTEQGRLEIVIDVRPGGDALVPIPDATANRAARDEDEPEAPTGSWPVGWDVSDGPTRLAAAGGLFALSSLSVPETTLNDFGAAVEAKCGVPVVLDVAALRAAGVDPATATVNVPPGRGNWEKAVRYAVAEHALKSELRRDEAGRGFLWVTPAKR